MPSGYLILTEARRLKNEPISSRETSVAVADDNMTDSAGYDSEKMETESDQGQPSPQLPRFRIHHLFYATSLIAAGLAFDTGTIAPSVIVLICWLLIFLSHSQAQTLAWLSLGFMTFLCCSGMLMPAVQQVQEAARRASCANNMRQIMLGMHNYESAYGHFPKDRIVKTQDGQELRHSWRIEILPFIEQAAIYEQYDFEEPWNGPSNSKLEALSWSAWNCPSHNPSNKTPYKLVVGPGTAFEDGQPKTFKDIPDGSSNTIGLIEDTANPVHWMEPIDLTVDEAVKILNSQDQKHCAHLTETPFAKFFIGFNFVTLDGGVGTWSSNSSNEQSTGVFLVDDGILFEFDLAYLPARKEIKYSGYVSLGIYLFLIVLPAFYLRRRLAQTKAMAKTNSSLED